MAKWEKITRVTLSRQQLGFQGAVQYLRNEDAIIGLAATPAEKQTGHI